MVSDLNRKFKALEIDEMKEKIIVALLAVVTVLTIAVVVSGLLALLVQALWNGCLVSAISGVNEISFLQAWGIQLLSGIIFKSVITTNKK